jgi:hypothetical protein
MSPLWLSSPLQYSVPSMALCPLCGPLSPLRPLLKPSVSTKALCLLYSFRPLYAVCLLYTVCPPCPVCPLYPSTYCKNCTSSFYQLTQKMVAKQQNDPSLFTKCLAKCVLSKPLNYCHLFNISNNRSFEIPSDYREIGIIAFVKKVVEFAIITYNEKQ